MIRTLLITALAFSCGVTFAEVQVGKGAPDFTLTDTNGKTHHLSEYKGKYVVLEWYNPDYVSKGVVWLSIDSSASGQEGNYPPSQLNQIATKNRSACTALLLDPDGKVGHLFGAKTTPDMYIINPQGTLVYQGAIDDKPSTDLGDVKTAKNYVKSALEAVMGGQTVALTSTRPYGCSVKYAP
jgi:hypothetical protein